MIEIKDKIIAFRMDGELVIFESRADFEATDLKEERINLLFASPGDLYRRFLEVEEVKAYVEREREEETNAGEEKSEEFSETTVRGIREREEDRWRKIKEGKEG